MNYENFTQIAQKALKQGSQIARIQNHKSIENGHILKGILALDKNVTPFLLQKLGIDVSDFEDTIDRIIASYMELYSGKLTVSSFVEKTLTEAMQFSKKIGDEYISIEHIIYGIIDAGDSVSSLFKNKKINKESLREAILELRKGVHVESKESVYYQSLSKYAINLNEQVKTGKLDPVIGRNDEIRRILQILSRRKKNNPVIIGEPGVGKTAIIEGLAHRIVKGDIPENMKTNQVYSLDLAALVAGASKKGEFEERLKSVVHEVIASNGEIILFIDEIHLLVGAGKGTGIMDAANILKPALARGELKTIGATTIQEYKYIENDKALERRFQKIIIDEPDSMTAVSILRGIQEKYENHHKVRILDDALIAAVEFSERYITDRFLPDKAIDLIDEAASKLRLERNSLPEEIDEIERQIRQLQIEKEVIKREEEEDAEKVKKLRGKIANLSDERSKLRAVWESEKELINKILETKREIENCKIVSEQAEREENFELIVEIKQGKLQKLKENLEKFQNELKEKQSGIVLFKEKVDRDTIAEIVSLWTGIPVTRMLQSEREKLLNLEKEIGKRVIGQKEAIAAVSNSIRRSRAGLQDSKRPVGSFIFLGTTGVGKTELAKALAEFLFSNEKQITRIDMSEYQEPHAVSKLIGSPPGYVGFEDGGQLTEAVRRKPYSVILFDEIEKAHKDVFNLLLQVLDDGNLTDSKGRKVNFKNTIIIMTSNAGADIIHSNFEKLTKLNRAEILRKTRNEVSEQLEKNISIEFMNRIDEIIMFTPLSYQEIWQIVALQLRCLRKKLERNKIQINTTKLAISWLSRVSYNPMFGARPIKRAIQKYVLDDLSKKILAGEISQQDIININYQDNILQFKNVTAEELEKISNQSVINETIEFDEDIKKEIQENENVNTYTEQKKKKKGLFFRIIRFFKKLFGKKY